MKFLKISAAAALLFVACSSKKPVVAPAATHSLVVHVRNEAGVGLSGATVIVDDAAPNPNAGRSAVTNENGDVTGWFLQQAGFTICAQPPAYQRACTGVTLTSDLTVSLTPASDYPLPAEAGSIHIDGKYFKDEAGAIWRWRGLDDQLLFARYLRGEDVSPRFADARRYGANVIRIFGGVTGKGWEPWTDYQRPDQRPDFAAKLQAFVDAAGAAGLRVEYVPLTYAMDKATMHAVLQSAFDALAGKTNVFITMANEPDAGQGIDVFTAAQGLNRHGILAAYGLENPVPPANWNGECDDAKTNGHSSLQTLDYVTAEPSRAEDWPRHFKDLLEYRDGGVSCPSMPGTNKPVVGVEPIGAAEQTVPGRRSADANDFTSGFGICAIYAAGCTYHSDDGLQGAALGPVQDSLALTVLKVWQFFPNDAQACSYTRGGLGDFPLVWHGDNDSLRSYGMICGDKAYVAQARPMVGHVNVAAPGWTISSQDETGELVFLTR